MDYAERYKVKTAGVNGIAFKWNEGHITYEQYRTLLDELDEFIDIITNGWEG